jgi:hypothetical protein
MSGLTEANVERLCDSLNQRIALALHANDRFSAGQLQGILSSIKNMQCENTKQLSRPDRVGDECWCGVYEQNVGYSWRKGILRAWCHGDCPAIVEDAETKEIDYFSRISFSSEAPSKPDHKPQD